MHFNNVTIVPLLKNIALVNNRNKGKTSTLKKYLAMYYNAGYSVLVIDSATEHADKSLAKYMETQLDDVLVIHSPEQVQIRRSNLLLADSLDIREIYPFEILKQNEKSLIAVDVARYLEEGYETEDPTERARLRQYYKEFALQVLYVAEHLFSNARMAVIMDEIELLSEMEWMVRRLNSKGIFIINALHNKDSLGKSSHLFEIYGD